MDFYFAVSDEGRYVEELKASRCNLLSFYYQEPKTNELIKRSPLAIIDSGAFTYLVRHKKSRPTLSNIEEYTEGYIEYMKMFAPNVRYMELDLDVIIGIEKVEQIRTRMERALGRQCIPVFHKQRGLDYWKRMCDEYDYVAIGSMVDYKNREDILQGLIDIAHKKNTKVHGLGYTPRDLKSTLGFDSTDSSSCFQGGRYVHFCYFNGFKICSKSKPEGKKSIHYKLIDRHNISEWLKYQKALERVVLWQPKK